MYNRNIEQESRMFVRVVLSELIARDPEKYRTFVRFLWSFRCLSSAYYARHCRDQWERGNAMLIYYAVMRFLDDSIDGDRVVPSEYCGDAVGFLQERMDILNGRYCRRRICFNHGHLSVLG